MGLVSRDVDSYLGSILQASTRNLFHHLPINMKMLNTYISWRCTRLLKSGMGPLKLLLLNVLEQQRNKLLSTTLSKGADLCLDCFLLEQQYIKEKGKVNLVQLHTCFSLILLIVTFNFMLDNPSCCGTLSLKPPICLEGCTLSNHSCALELPETQYWAHQSYREGGRNLQICQGCEIQYF
jgi:hypothetical protein